MSALSTRRAPLSLLYALAQKQKSVASFDEARRRRRETFSITRESPLSLSSFVRGVETHHHREERDKIRERRRRRPRQSRKENADTLLHHTRPRKTGGAGNTDDDASSFSKLCWPQSRKRGLGEEGHLIVLYSCDERFSSLSNWKKKRRKEIKNWKVSNVYVSTEYRPLSRTHTHTHIALYTYPRRERERAKKHAHARDRQTDQTLSSKSPVSKCRGATIMMSSIPMEEGKSRRKSTRTTRRG